MPSAFTGIVVAGRNGDEIMPGIVGYGLRIDLQHCRWPRGSAIDGRNSIVRGRLMPLVSLAALVTRPG